MFENPGLIMASAITEAAAASLSILRSEISNVRYCDAAVAVSAGHESIDFDFRGQTHRAPLIGRLADRVIGHSLAADRSLALSTLLDKSAKPLAQLTLTGPMLVSLMRRHRVKIRDVKAKHGVTLKRIREVRETGLTGFAAEEWHWLITGQWPEPGWSFDAQK